MEVLVDSNIILDVLTDDPLWFGWSSEKLAYEAERNILVINPIIYAEISMRFASIEDLEEVLDPLFFRKDRLPWEAAFLAGKAYLEYRKKGGRKIIPLPDFFIGAHAAVRSMPLLTRDRKRYKSYFPTLNFDCSMTHFLEGPGRKEWCSPREDCPCQPFSDSTKLLK